MINQLFVPVNVTDRVDVQSNLKLKSSYLQIGKVVNSRNGLAKIDWSLGQPSQQRPHQLDDVLFEEEIVAGQENAS